MKPAGLHFSFLLVAKVQSSCPPTLSLSKERHCEVHSFKERCCRNMELPQNFSTALGLHRKAGPITTLHIFDFDGTLVNTPGPEEGKRKYFEATGNVMKGGWWGRAESLSPPVVESPCPPSLAIRSVFNKMEEVMTRSQTEVGVVVTGRITPLREYVVRILHELCRSCENETVASGQSFLHPDAVMTHPGGRPSTLDFKQDIVKVLLTSEPLVRCDMKELHIWEDRKEHAEFFATVLADKVRVATGGVETTVHFVPELLP